MSAKTFLVKICGLSTLSALDAAIGAGASLAGFVHFPRSPRHVDAEAFKSLAAWARGRVGIVLLTVNADDALLDALIEAGRPDFLQLHGTETPGRVQALKARHRLPIIKAMAIAGEADMAAVSAFEGIADYLLFDAKAPKEATRPGGLGRTFDWALLKGRVFRTPFLLSGGLDLTNVEEAIRRVRPQGVDVSSGVETAPGIKDEALIAAFTARAREAAGGLMCA